MASHARAERAALADVLAGAGPDAPTLCGGWTTRDLAAHLVARERRPDSSPGLVLRPLAGWTERVRRGKAALPYERLVELVRTGPPRTSVFALPGADEAANTVEFFVHLEDVRRAGGGEITARELDPGLEEALWRRVRSMSRLMLRKVPVGVTLVREGGSGTDRVPARGAGPVVTMTGPAPELLLYLYGRKDQALVRLDGPPDAVAALAAAPLGI